MLLWDKSTNPKDPGYDFREQMRRTAFRIPGKDDISKQVNAAVKEIEDLCRPFIEDVSKQ